MGESHAKSRHVGLEFSIARGRRFGGLWVHYLVKLPYKATAARAALLDLYLESGFDKALLRS